MGASASSMNSTQIEENASVNYTASCDQSQLVQVTNGTVEILHSSCGSISVNTTDVGEQANCKFNTKISAVAKAAADNNANSSSSTSFPSGVSSSLSSNVVAEQENIEMALATSCGEQQNANVTNRPVILNGDVVPGACDLNSSTFSANLTCLANLQAQLAESGTATQTATSTATTSLDPMLILLILGGVLLALVFFMGGGKAIFKAIKAPAKAASNIGKGGQAADARLAQAQANLAQARQMAARRGLTAATTATGAGAAPGAGFVARSALPAVHAAPAASMPAASVPAAPVASVPAAPAPMPAMMPQQPYMPPYMMPPPPQPWYGYGYYPGAAAPPMMPSPMPSA